jgi:hypothetical protein
MSYQPQQPLTPRELAFIEKIKEDIAVSKIREKASDLMADCKEHLDFEGHCMIAAAFVKSGMSLSNITITNPSPEKP